MLFKKEHGKINKYETNANICIKQPVNIDI